MTPGVVASRSRALFWTLKKHRCTRNQPNISFLSYNELRCRVSYGKPDKGVLVLLKYNSIRRIIRYRHPACAGEVDGADSGASTSGINADSSHIGHLNSGSNSSKKTFDVGVVPFVPIAIYPAPAVPISTFPSPFSTRESPVAESSITFNAAPSVTSPVTGSTDELDAAPFTIVVELERVRIARRTSATPANNHRGRIWAVAAHDPIHRIFQIHDPLNQVFAHRHDRSIPTGINSRVFLPDARAPDSW